MKDGGPAFPMKEIVCDDGEPVLVTQCYPGMSLRDYFAAKAMQTIINDNKMSCDAQDEMDTDDEYYYNFIAEESFRISDAMLKARDK